MSEGMYLQLPHLLYHQPPSPIMSSSATLSYRYTTNQFHNEIRLADDSTCCLSNSPLRLLYIAECE